jgi:hypothetical protein
MSQEQLVHVLTIICLAGAALGVCLLVLAAKVFGELARLDSRARDLEGQVQYIHRQVAKSQGQAVLDDEEAG